MFTKVRKQAYSILIFQLMIVLLVASVVLFFSNWHSGISVLLGGAAYLIPSIFLIIKTFPFRVAAGEGDKILGNFYRGELIKLVLSFVLLLLLFRFIPVKIIFVLIGYGAASLALLLLPVASCLKGLIRQ